MYCCETIWSLNYDLAFDRDRDHQSFFSHTVYLKEIEQFKYVWYFSFPSFDLFIPFSWHYTSICNNIVINYIHFHHQIEAFPELELILSSIDLKYFLEFFNKFIEVFVLYCIWRSTLNPENISQNVIWCII